MNIRSQDYLTPMYSHRRMDVRIGFEPSDDLDAALQRFLMPQQNPEANQQARSKRLFRSTIRQLLPIIDSDSDGPIFARSDRVRLGADKNEIAIIARQRIAVGWQARYKHDIDGNVMIEITALPTEDQRRHLGHFVLDKWAPATPLSIFTILPAGELADVSEQRKAAHKLEAELRGDTPHQSPGEHTTPAKQIYVSEASIVMSETSVISRSHPDIL